MQEQGSLAGSTAEALAAILASSYDHMTPGLRAEAAHQIGRRAIRYDLQLSTIRPALRPLARLLNDKCNPEGSSQAAYAFRQLTRTPELRSPIADTAKRALADALQTPQDSTQAAAALANLACQKNLAIPVGRLSIRALSTILGESNVEARVQAARALSNLAYHDEHMESICDAAMDNLVRLLRDTANPEARSEAAEIVHRLSYSDDKKLRRFILDAVHMDLEDLMQRSNSYSGSAAAKKALMLLSASSLKHSFMTGYDPKVRRAHQICSKTTPQHHSLGREAACISHLALS